MFPDPQVVDDTFGFRCWTGTPSVMAKAHRHDDIEVNAVAGGGATYLFGGLSMRVDSGAVAAFWATMPHQLVQADPATTVHWLTVPLSLFLGWSFPDAARATLLSVRPLVASVPEHTSGRAGFDVWAKDLGSTSVERQQIAALEIQAWLRRLAREALPPSSTAEPVPAFGHAAAMASFIARHYAEPIGPADVAGDVHLHPHYAMGVFRRVVGTTLGSYLTACRVAQAQRLLIGTDLAVGEVAARTGFGSTSRFYVAFREACGVPPATYRRRLGAPAAAP